MKYELLSDEIKLKILKYMFSYGLDNMLYEFAVAKCWETYARYYDHDDEEKEGIITQIFCALFIEGV